ncbi:MAG: hypothetical protein RBT20_01820 [Syntrophales bacterium]|jgi:hypothetical protein|nr:hypothetical protein [Syntrophales bacterium]
MKKLSVTRFQRIIEDTNWDNELIDQEDKFNSACWLLIFIAVLFFGLVIAGMLTR